MALLLAQVAPLNNGGFLVADGYCASRILKFDSNGKLAASSSLLGMRVVHSVAVDECRQMAYVADRESGKANAAAFSDALVEWLRRLGCGAWLRP